MYVQTTPLPRSDVRIISHVRGKLSHLFIFMECGNVPHTTPLRRALEVHLAIGSGKLQVEGPADHGKAHTRDERKNQANQGLRRPTVAMRGAREPEHVLRGSELVNIPATFWFCLLDDGLGAVRDDEHEVESAGGQLRLPVNPTICFDRERNHRRNDAVGAQIIQLFGWEQNSACESLINDVNLVRCAPTPLI